MAYQPCWLFNAKSSLYLHSKCIGFGLVGFYGISTIVGYLMPNPVFAYILNICVNTFCRSIRLNEETVLFQSGISTIVGYLMPNPLYIYIYI